MGQNPKCSGYDQKLFTSKISDIIEERTKETSENSVKRSDVTGNRFEWELGKNKVIYDPLPRTPMY